REKEAARKEYQKAMLRGDSAYMMTNDESNIFRMHIGKIAAGETVKVKIDYIDHFDIVDNQIRILIPTLVPPRYQSEVTGKLNYSKDEVAYRGNVTVCFDKSLYIEDIESKTHSIKLENNTVTARNIKLEKDFVLDVRLAAQAFSKGYCHALPNGNQVVYLSFFPDIEMEAPRKSKDYVFVIDVSGSMSGFKLEQTKEAVIKCLKQLSAGDRVNVIAFERDYALFSEHPVEYNAENYEKAKKFVQSLQARGGTELFAPLQNVLQRADGEKIIFLFTDGEVGNESEIAGYVRKNIGHHALFVFGIDSSVNKKGLCDIAEAGRGKAEFIVKDELIQEMIIRQFGRVLSANLFDVALNPKTNKVIDKIEKSRVLFNHEFYDVLIETDHVADDFELICQSGDKMYSFVIAKEALAHSALPLDKIYASEQIRRAEKYINSRWDEDHKGYRERIVEIAVEYQIDSKYTAFIAVNERGEKLTDVPDRQDTMLEAPAGWNMMTHPKAGELLCCYACEASLMPENDDAAVTISLLFEKIKECEALISQNRDYQTVFDEIVDTLRPHFAAPSKAYKALFRKMKRATPKVYALVALYL
ncbi:MAG: VIT and VWA domain-containing protein, partial [Dysgonamonadaceae bacterium]|nr:VIT and VWA domain-containing protein [Dysgonamonadaceae bacterium]